jgi:hypothetical protein
MRTVPFGTAAAMLCAAFMYVGTVAPPQWDNKPYYGKLRLFVGAHLVRKHCGSARRDETVAACAYVGRGRCTIFMPDRSDPQWAVIYRHELAHCLGWPGNHPGARWV